MTATTKTHIIDALDEFYGVRCQDKIRGVGGGGGLIEEEEDMNEFDEDVVCSVSYTHLTLPTIYSV